MKQITITPELARAIPDSRDAFDFFMSIAGTVFRRVSGRETLAFVLGDQQYFIKKHVTAQHTLRLRNLLRRAEPSGALPEWQAMQYLQKHGIKTPEIAAFGQKESSTGQQQSFLVTRALPSNLNLDEVSRAWQNTAPTFRFKQLLIKKIASTVRNMHACGVNHRDLYLLHFHLPANTIPQDITCGDIEDLYLLDLHRAQIRKRVPKRWRIKDLAGLYFSSLETALTQRDYFRFIRYYSGKSLRELFSSPRSKRFWQTIKRKGHALYRKRPIR